MGNKADVTKLGPPLFDVNHSGNAKAIPWDATETSQLKPSAAPWTATWPALNCVKNQANANSMARTIPTDRH